MSYSKGILEVRKDFMVLQRNYILEVCLSSKVSSLSDAMTAIYYFCVTFSALFKFPILNINFLIFHGLAIDGKYTEWKESECSVTCGGGVMTKTRTCTNPAPQHGGKDCSELGPAKMTLSCNEQPCRKNL